MQGGGILPPRRAGAGREPKPNATHVPLNRSESQARTRAALLDAAEALIVEHSILALSLRAVCTRAGYTQGATVRHFSRRPLASASLTKSMLQTALGEAAADSAWRSTDGLRAFLRRRTARFASRYRR